jgi:DNA-binding response OmpR family regulator
VAESGLTDKAPAGASMLAVFAPSVTPEIARTLDLAGYSWKGVSTLDEAAEHEPADGWLGIIIDCTADSERAWACARAMRKVDGASVNVLILVTGAQLDELDLRDSLFDDFCLSPFHPSELEARIRHLVWTTGDAPIRSEIVEHGELSLNLETYQASIGGRPLDLTYMEYELLKFLAQNPGKVFTREILLSRVWGYEYYGGARTVDVHIRRLRAKLGEEHAGLIQTVRSVGYRFGQFRWGG